MKQKRKGSGGRFLTGLLGGAVGGLLIVGGFYLANGSTLAPSSSSNNSSSTSEPAKVSNVKVDVDSDITSAVEKVQGAVVSVINLQAQQQSSDNPWGDMFGQQEEDSSAENTDDSNLMEASEGSGVIYNKDGDSAYVVTNNHVVEGSDGLEVVMSDGTKVKGELMGTDAVTDLAVIKISSDNVEEVATFGDSSALKVGEPAIAIGSPLGSQYANSVTSGIISSVNRPISDSTSGVNISAIQTDAAINPGNSGGPLVNIAGQVIGINSSKIASTSTESSDISVEGMGFAIPSNDVVKIIDQLQKDGKVTRPALGINMVDLSSVTSQQQEQILGVPSSVKSGVVITNVMNATPAEKAGLKQYDVITKVDGEEVTSATDLQSILYGKNVGDTITIAYYRGDKESTAKVDLTIDSSALQQNQQNQNNNQ
ncbi:trypsin-like peptidase domain-containing protein [Enterococcus asini]|uniref:S1C family serine protease n=1 Tax=Enterococcus asini TaxID=57732 RepID=UPI001E4D1BB3|nr:trypsin-like peptidase domain-containing protein [Enterococcus asini]MCD5027936.1 trypsin-like peptidase domain-containing protein [Enterococcus asini]MDT2763574.1 trypsin-like peptidase domain-containing protein [Enterococcus asini]MDT2784174.1 trypsin-like peptidase domain-containing protein [Enterococcus asini]